MFDQDDQGNWNLSAGWKAHSGSVWKVTWSNPEFGQVLATCSYDRTASIWEETGRYILLYILYIIIEIYQQLMFCSW